MRPTARPTSAPDAYDVWRGALLAPGSITPQNKATKHKEDGLHSHQRPKGGVSVKEKQLDILHGVGLRESVAGRLRYSMRAAEMTSNHMISSHVVIRMV